MAWPTIAEFSAALADPKGDALAPSLRAWRFPDRGADGLSIPIVGRSAAVYRAVDPSGSSKAVRVFLLASRDRSERYGALARHLEAHHPACIVEFRHLDEAIRMPDGRSYPALMMDWVEGQTLAGWVRERCLRSDRDALGRAAVAWVGLLHDLAEAGLAHGDLEATNVLVTAVGSLRLVDYDTLDARGLARHVATEFAPDGNPLQHPGRSAGTPLAPDQDTFAALALLVELKALAADPGLIDRRAGHGDGPSLLFDADDLRDPMGSRLLDALLVSSDPEVRRLAGVLFHLYEFPLADLPALHELVRLEPSPVGEPTLPEDPSRWREFVEGLAGSPLEALARRLREAPPSPGLVGLAPSPIRRGVEVIEGGRSFEVRWTWPDPAVAPRCLLAVCDRPPTPRDDPRTIPARRRWELKPGDFAPPFRIHPGDDWRGGIVAAWALIELGPVRFHSAPLVLGRLGPAPGAGGLLGRFLGALRPDRGRARGGET